MPHSHQRSREQNFRHLFSQYKIKARKRKLTFDLTPERFKELTKKPCFLCGKRPAAKHRKDARAIYKTPYLYNGIDRFDNREGYIEGNVVSCCWDCNRAKGEMSVEKFLLYILRAYNHSIKPAINEGLPNVIEETEE